jgi:hypothetical protein
VDSGIDQTLVETGAAPSPASTTYDDSAVNVAFDTWVGVSNATASGGTYRISGTKSAKAAFTFSGSAVTWITRKGPDQGIASVTIDGILKGAVNLYSGSALASSVSYSGLASGTHKLVITVTGRKGATSTGTNVVIDAFAVGASTTQDFSSAVEYDAWRGAIVTAASGGTERVDVKVGATSTLNFTGTSVQWVTATGPSSGMASVTIDGVSRGTVDLYSSTVHHKVAETYSGLALGSHSVVITVLGTRNALSKGDGVVVDAFIVNA